MADQHILIVEDDTDLAIVLTQVLEMEGYRVSAASRRVEALAVLGQGDVDLIVADSVLRGGNGDDIAKAAGERAIPVIMISGEPGRIARLRGGPLPFIEKPFRATELIQLVSQLLA